jgi:Sigma-70, region 4
VLGKSEAELEAAALRAARTDGTDTVHLRLALIQGLAQLPPRQRAVLVLRYWEQLTAAAISLTVASSGPGTPWTEPGTPRAGAQAARSPRARLVAAMTTSAQLSYRLHLVNTSVLPDHQATPTSPPRDLIDWYADYTGVYDPATRSGTGANTIRLPSGTLDNPSTYGEADSFFRVRIVGGNYYTQSSGSEGPWRMGQGTLVQALVLNGGRAWAPTDGASADPAVLLAAVRNLGTVTFAGRTGNGAMALDTYNFSYNIAGDGSVAAHQLTGTIVVHDQSNLVAEITMQTTVTGASPQIADSGSTTFRTVMTFSDYGVHVSVRAPTAIAVPKKR